MSNRGDRSDKWHSILNRDESIRRRAIKSIGPTVDLCDEALDYNLSHILAIEGIEDQWTNDREFRVAFAFVNHAWNHLNCARMLSLAGYTSESFLLLRESLDATAKAHLFHNSTEWAGKFLDGSQIWSRTVRNAIEEMYRTSGNETAGGLIARYLSNQYARLSKFGHANLDALKHRISGIDHTQYVEDPSAAIREFLGRGLVRGGIDNLFWVGFGLQEVVQQALVTAQVIITFNVNRKAEHIKEVEDLMRRVNNDRVELRNAVGRLEQ